MDHELFKRRDEARAKLDGKARQVFDDIWNAMPEPDPDKALATALAVTAGNDGGGDDA